MSSSQDLLRLAAIVAVIVGVLYLKQRYTSDELVKK